MNFEQNFFIVYFLEFFETSNAKYSYNNTNRHPKTSLKGLRTIIK